MVIVSLAQEFELFLIAGRPGIPEMTRFYREREKIYLPIYTLYNARTLCFNYGLKRYRTREVI